MWVLCHLSVSLSSQLLPNPLRYFDESQYKERSQCAVVHNSNTQGMLFPNVQRNHGTGS
jgi:hypothetical protein